MDNRGIQHIRLESLLVTSNGCIEKSPLVHKSSLLMSLTITLELNICISYIKWCHNPSSLIFNLLKSILNCLYLETVFQNKKLKLILNIVTLEIEDIVKYNENSVWFLIVFLVRFDTQPRWVLYLTTTYATSDDVNGCINMFDQTWGNPRSWMVLDSWVVKTNLRPYLIRKSTSGDVIRSHA